MLAEQKSDDGDAPSSSWRPKPWEVTNVDGYLAWKLRIDAMISSNSDLAMFAGIDIVTEALATAGRAGVPGYAAMAPARGYILHSKCSKGPDSWPVATACHRM